ncbi:hypothetical protein CF54_02495 [Streptomyces sp. Tu 6176]|nr:hypothetical protein CF54_02495 [Streptomyces sp. Tu 6176]
MSAAAAVRWPWRSRAVAARPRRVAERNPAAKASPAPTWATTSTRGAGTKVAAARAAPPARSWTVAPSAPCLTTTVRGPSSASRISAPLCSPHASRASSSPTKTRSAPRARSSSTRAPAGSGHSPGRKLTSKETSGRPGRGAVRARSRPRQPADRAAVMPDRCSTRQASRAAVATVSAVIAEAADPAR